jgi:hypothetical protein
MENQFNILIADDDFGVYSASIKPFVHSLRHTCLTNLANGYGMDTPLPLPQVQKIAGHRDIGTTMRYVRTDGIKNTGSRQWSRSQRKGLKEIPAMEAKATGTGTPLRLISGGPIR